MDFRHVKQLLVNKGYNVGSEINRGSFAAVHTAEKIKGDPSPYPLAVKVVDRCRAPKDFIEKFFPKELAIMRELDHNNVIRTFEVVRAGWFTCIFMEQAEGGDLLSLIMKKGFLAEPVTKRLFVEIVHGLEYCHNQDIAHRDIKCENILLDKEGHVKLADFGFARWCLDPVSKKRQLSSTYCGSVAYAAPEVLTGSPYNPKLADWWSMGIVLYIMMNGIMPFDDTDHLRLVRDQTEKRWSFNPDRKQAIGPNCRRLVRLLLEPDIMNRATLHKVKESEWLTGLFKAKKRKKSCFGGIF